MATGELFTNIGYVLGGLAAGAATLGGVQRYRKRNGGNGTDRIVKAVSDVAKAVRDEGQETRKVMHQHNGAINATLAVMRENCSVAHGRLLDRASDK